MDLVKKKRILSINSSCVGSTGKIMTGIMSAASKDYFVAVAYPFLKANNEVKDSKINVFPICSYSYLRLSFHLTKLFGKDGAFNYFHTRRLCKYILKNKFDIIHLHNLHTSFINYKYLFKFFKKYNIKIVWTLHDCWAFTGHCPHFVMEKCDKWKTGCYACPSYKNYPQSFFDNSKQMYSLKKKVFTQLDCLTIVTPSFWLARLVKESFLKDYPIKVIHNGIDLSVFHPIKSDFRRNNHIDESDYMLLGVAFDWGKRKGLDVFVTISKLLPDNYKIVLVGTNREIDKELPDKIISINKTHNQTELAKIYSAANLFVNPTREEVLGLVNIEALACGTPVLTFDTGGSPECIDETCGRIVACDDINSLVAEIINICEEKPFSSKACISRAKMFDKKDRFKDYLNLYKKL